MTIYQILAYVLAVPIGLVFWTLASLLEVGKRWIAHDLKMRRGGRE